MSQKVTRLIQKFEKLFLPLKKQNLTPQVQVTEIKQKKNFLKIMIPLERPQFDVSNSFKFFY